MKLENAHTPMKVLPPWMIKDGMRLTKEQRGETNAEIKTGATLTASEVSDDKKSTTVNNEEKNIQVLHSWNLLYSSYSTSYLDFAWILPLIEN